MLLFLAYDKDTTEDIETWSSEELFDPILAMLAEKAGVEPLENFLSANDEEYQDIEQTQWFAPSLGIKTVSALLSELQQDTANRNEAMVNDLQQLLAALHVLDASGCQFYLTME